MLYFIFRMDKDGSLNIDYDEWRDFLLLAPSSDLHELVKYWRHSTVSIQPYHNNLRLAVTNFLGIHSNNNNIPLTFVLYFLFFVSPTLKPTKKQIAQISNPGTLLCL